MRHLGCGPTYGRARSGQSELVALAQAPVVHFDRNDDLQRGWLRDRLDDRPMPPGRHIPTTEAFELAVRSGLGWGMLSEYQLASERTPAIVTLDDSVAQVSLYWQRWKLTTPALDHLTSLVITAARRALGPRDAAHGVKVRHGHPRCRACRLEPPEHR